MWFSVDLILFAWINQFDLKCVKHTRLVLPCSSVMFYFHIMTFKKLKFFNHQNQSKANCIKTHEPSVNNCLSPAGESTQILNSSERINKIWTLFILTNQKKLEQVRVKSKRRSFGLSELFQESSRLSIILMNDCLMTSHRCHSSPAVIIFKSAWVHLTTCFNSFTVWNENDDIPTTNWLHVKIHQEHVQPLLIFHSWSLNAVVTVLWLRCDFYVSSSVMLSCDMKETIGVLNLSNINMQINNQWNMFRCWAVNFIDWHEAQTDWRETVYNIKNWNVNLILWLHFIYVCWINDMSINLIFRFH